MLNASPLVRCLSNESRFSSSSLARKFFFRGCNLHLERASMWSWSDRLRWSQLPSDPARALSTSAETVSGSTESDVQFWHAKAEDLFERITSRLSRDEVRVLADVTNAILGRPVRDNEFYYRGFGGRKGGGSSSGGAEAEGASAAQAAAQGKTTVDIKLVSFDAAAKLKVIKEVRSMLSELGLKDAKELVESAPKILQKGVSVEKAEELKKKLHEAGAEIELV